MSDTLTAEMHSELYAYAGEDDVGTAARMHQMQKRQLDGVRRISPGIIEHSFTCGAFKAVERWD